MKKQSAPEMRYLNLVKNVVNWWSYLVHKFGIIKRDVLIFHIRGGLMAEVPIRMLQTFKEIFFAEDYTKHFPKGFLKTVNPVILDVGANTGYFSLYMLSKYPTAKVLAFEPVPLNLKLLEKHEQLNPEFDLTVVAKAVSGKPGTLTLKFDASDAFTTSASVFDNSIGTDELQVTCLTIPMILKQFHLDRIDFLKLDCEGSEYNILYNCPDDSLRKISYLALETHQGPGETENQKSLAEFLKQKGFNVKTDQHAMLWASQDPSA